MSRFIFYCTPEDQSYLHHIKPLFAGHQVALRTEVPVTRAQILQDNYELRTDGCITTSQLTLRKVVQNIDVKNPTLNDFNGSMVKLDHETGLSCLVLNPLEHAETVPYGKFLLKRFVSKLTQPETWFKQTQFKWNELTGENIERAFMRLAVADFIAVDIETAEARWITTVSYTGFWYSDARGWESHSYVLDLKGEWAYTWMKKLNRLDVPKALQNGKYDSAYFFRYGAPLRNWKYDTINMMHCIYSELPKDLGSITPFFLRDVEFWKDEGKTGNKQDYLRYNARDGWATGNVVLSWLREAPEYAVANYLQEFPLVFPCHLSEMQGIRVDEELFMERKAQEAANVAALEAELDETIGTKGFNSGSPRQVLTLLRVLGNTDFKSSDETHLRKAMFKHPIAGRIVNIILKLRKSKKLVSTYLNETKIWNGKLLYTLNPHGTDTARLASQSSAFDTGWQIQNQPARDKTYKRVFISDDGFLFGEADYEQAEARDVAYLSGDAHLIEAVDSGADYHSTNASRFFGLPYESIIDIQTGEVINKEIRDLSKRVNHGANYNMGWYVLIDTMGLENIFRAARLLKLPFFWSAKQIAEFLLARYDETYPTIRGPYYEYIIDKVITTKMLVSPLGWTRYCFGNPKKNKQQLNSLVAHPSQNLNAGTLNRAYMRIFKDVALPNMTTFRLNAQIHDSVLFQYRQGHEHHILQVKECMEMKIPVTDMKGKTRELLVPVGIKAGSTRWGDLKTWKPAAHS